MTSIHSPHRIRSLLSIATWLLFGLVCVLSACGKRERTRPDALPIATNASANDILFRAISLVGTPYRYGGNTPESGFDCSGLIGFVFGEIAGLVLPRSADAISRLDAVAIARGRLQPGDLVFFRDGRTVSHVGIYVGEGRFVHAPSSGGTVRLDALDGDYWRKHYAGAKRVLR